VPDAEPGAAADPAVVGLVGWIGVSRAAWLLSWLFGSLSLEAFPMLYLSDTWI
jgi:hypothetical protein